MVVDWSLNVGHLLTIIGFLGAGIGLYVAMRSDILSINEKMSFMSGRVINVENKLDKFSVILSELARQGARLDAQDKRVDDMQRAANEWRAWARPRLENGVK